VAPDETDTDEIEPPKTGLGAASKDAYIGKARKAAKLSTGSGPVEDFDDLLNLLGTLPPESSMAHHNPPISDDENSGRVAEEQRNVRVRCFLYAASKERDNDFHLILGRDPGASPERYMTMEVSGLPPANFPSSAALRAARKSFKDFFGNNLPGTSYDFYDPPIPVVVEGSLFFDFTHLHGSRPGPSSLRPNMPVIWEVHPVTGITFEP